MGQMPKSLLSGAAIKDSQAQSRFEFVKEQEVIQKVKQEKGNGFFQDLARFLLNFNPLFPINSASNNDEFNQN